MASRLPVVAILVLLTASCLNAFPQAANNPAPAAQPAAGHVGPAVHAGAHPPAPASPHGNAAAPTGKYFQDRVRVPYPNAKGMTAREIVSVLGNPKPFQLQTLDRGTIVIYCRADDIKNCDSTLLKTIESDIKKLAGEPSSPKPQLATYEITVPHAVALGDVAKAANDLNFSTLKIEAVGKDKIRVSPAKDINEQEYSDQLAKFEVDLNHIAWQLNPQSPISRVYYVDAADAARAMGAKVPADTSDTSKISTPAADAGEKTGATDSTGKAGSGSSTSGGKSAQGKGSAGKGGDSTGKSTSAAGKGASDTGAAENPPAGNSEQPEDSVNKPTTDGNTLNAATGGDKTKTEGGDGSQKSPKEDSGNSSDIQIFNPDLLVFSDRNPGNDSIIAEQKRIVAGIDFPRPEVIINTFSFQTSSSDPNVLAERDRILRSRIGVYNDSIQGAMYRAWFYLEGQINPIETTDGEISVFFDPFFYGYITNGYIGKPRPLDEVEECPPGTVGGTTVPSNRNSDAVSLKSSATETTAPCKGRAKRPLPALEEASGCKNTKVPYCLGYTSFLNPLRPNLTDLLFAAIASQDPPRQLRKALDQMQGFKIDSKTTQLASDNKSTGLTGKSRDRRCSSENFCHVNTDWESQPCDQKDIYAWESPDKLTKLEGPGVAQLPTVSQSIAARLLEPGSQASPNIFPMFCFREAIEVAFPYNTQGMSSPDGKTVPEFNPLNLGLPLRAALANFLFEYKMSQQYPHEFSAYALSQTAQELNSELNPLIVAFNRDLAAALEPLKSVANCEVNCGSHHGTGKTEFVNNGIITVRTVSGKETTVDTVTQNYFDATAPPSITDVINSVGQAQSNIPNVLKTNLTANEAAVIIGALNSVQPSTSKIGRQFLIDITPRSLNGASSAELNLYLKTADVAPPTRYSSGKSDEDNLSRIASQTVNTKVRLESIKLFEISSFSATLERSRQNFPVLPPFVTIPYVGSFLSWPVKAAAQYHRSTAVMSAVVVPTAADLANGVAFTDDRICVDEADTGNKSNGPEKTNCRTRRAISLYDFSGSWIPSINKRVVNCLANGTAGCSYEKLHPAAVQSY
jgi:hypothetical protein